MENVIHRLTLDLTGPDTIPRVEVQQDNARSLSISLTQGGRPYWIAEGVTAVFSARKPDGNPLFNACTVEKNRVRYDFTEQTTNVAGIVECEILLYSGDERILASPRFELAIDELIHRDGDVPESAPEIGVLDQMIARGTAMLEDLQEALAGLEGVEDILTQARAAAEAASNSEAAAKGHAKTAAKAAEDALTLAGQANSASQQSNKYASEALGHRQAAEAAAQEAKEAAANLPQGGGNGSGQNADYPAYKNFKAAFLGDSQTAESSAKTKTWWQWVVELLGITNYVNYGKIGATLSNVGTSNTPICTTCEQMDSDVTIVFVMGGVNEFRGDTQTSFGTIADTTPETVSGAVRYICRKLQAKYPKTPIIFITPTNQTLWTHKDGHSMADLAKAIMDACRMEGVLCLDAQGSLGINPAYDSSYTSDRLHLNDLGSELLGKWVVNQVRQHIPILSSSPDGSNGDIDKTLTSISATYSGGSVPVGTVVTTLTGIVVTAHYSDGTSANVTGYALSGTITEGNNIITVSYDGKTTTFTVTGVADSSGGEEEPEPPVVTLTSISATFDQGSATIKTTDSLDKLKQYLTVTAHYSDGSDETVTDYTLSGSLTAGTSVVTVSYAGKTTTFTATVNEVKVVTLNMGDYSYTSGKYIGMNGAESGAAGFAYTEKIPIPANTEITYNTDVTINPIFYDAERNFISANSKYGGEQGSPGELTVITPANCAYLVMNMVVNTGASAYYVKYEQ